MAATAPGEPPTGLAGRELEQDLLSEPRLAASAVEFVRRLPSTHSELFEFRIRSGIQTRMIVAKRQASGADAERRTLQEFTNLEKVRGALGLAGRQSIPRAILVLPQKGLLVTEKVCGISFAAILRKNANRLVGSFRGTFVLQTGQCIGRWLRDFQTATQSEPLTFQADRFLTHLERHVSRCRERGLGTASALALLRQASVQAARLNGQSVPAAGRHGDFIPQNIIVREQNHVAVVDFEGFRERQPVYDDLGTFLAYLAVLSARFHYSRHSLNAAAKGFLSGFLQGNPLDPDCVNLYILKGAVRILADGPLRKGMWDRWLVQRMLRRLRESNGKINGR